MLHSQVTLPFLKPRRKVPSIGMSQDQESLPRPCKSFSGNLNILTEKLLGPHIFSVTSKASQELFWQLDYIDKQAVVSQYFF